MEILILTSFTKNITFENYGDCDIIDENEYIDKHLTWIKIEKTSEKLCCMDRFISNISCLSFVIRTLTSINSTRYILYY